MSDLVFKRNLLALSRSDPSLGDRLLSVEPDTRLILRSARSGAAVPVLRLAEREVAFHSLIDPEREAERMVSAQPPGGFIVALGLGAGYLLRAYLASTSTTGLVVVEHSASLLRALLELIDLSELFIDQRFSLMLDPEPDELSAQLLTMYVPPLAGDLRSLPLRGRVDLDKDRFQRSADAVRDVLGRISDDYSVQAFFGKLWLKNAARNLFSSEGAGAVLPPVRRAAVAAAGPSLEASIPLLARAKDGGAFIIATDTSLPALLGAGLEPNVVISIDCQHISYYHFLGGFPAALPLVLDLSSPNRIARMGAPVRFFSSGHPFCAYISSRHRAFPALDTSGGNVTHAALSLAEALGSEETLLAGADFSYPEGKSYARGTYIYGYFGQRSRRLTPVEGLFAGFVFRNSVVTREEDEDAEGRSFGRYLTKPLMAYKAHLERFAARSSMNIVPLPGKGVAIATPTRAARTRERRPLFAPGPAHQSAATFLEGYATDLRALPEAQDPSLRYLHALSPEQRDLWTTLLPAASTLQREAGERRMAPAELLETTRSWAVKTIEDALEEGLA